MSTIKDSLAHIWPEINNPKPLGRYDLFNVLDKHITHQVWLHQLNVSNSDKWEFIQTLEEKVFIALEEYINKLPRIN